MRGAVLGAALLSLTALTSLTTVACSSGDDTGGLPQFTSGTGGSVASPSTGSTGGASGTSTGPSTGSASATAAPLVGAELVTVGLAAPPAADAAAVFRGYVEFWQADMAALTRSDPTWKPLLDRLSGQQRTDTVALLTGNRTKRQKITGTITIRPQVLVVRGPTASVSDCVDLSRTRAVDAQGAAVAGTQGSAGSAYTTTLVLVGSTWTVSNIDRRTDPTCT